MRFISLILVVFIVGCANRYQNTALGVAVAGQTPMAEVEQIYYIGVYDPLEQLPPQMYRIRVRGQASLGITKFASGWVPAQVIDALNLQASDVSSSGYGKEDAETFLEGRKFVVFGPEGFREVPKSHRLVLAMGNNPDAIFQAASKALGQISNAERGLRASGLNEELFRALTKVLSEQQRIQDFEALTDE